MLRFSMFGRWPMTGDGIELTQMNAITGLNYMPFTVHYSQLHCSAIHEEMYCHIGKH